jgi:hypothetical protein
MARSPYVFQHPTHQIPTHTHTTSHPPPIPSQNISSSHIPSVVAVVYLATVAPQAVALCSVLYFLLLIDISLSFWSWIWIEIHTGCAIKLYPFFHQSLRLSKILEKNLLRHCRDTCVYCWITAVGMLIDGFAWRSAERCDTDGATPWVIYCFMESIV